MEEDQIFREDSSDSPHFGDEQTLREAQPVVPLAEIHSNHVRNRLLMSLALVLALGLGAGGALLLVQIQQPSTHESSISKPQTKDSTGEDATVAAVGEEPNGEEEEMIDVATSEDSTSEAQPVKKPQRRTISHAGNSDLDARTSPPVVVKTDDAAKKPILVDQWEEKRSRRVTPNEPARANVRRRDLFRIRDIFEGARP